MVVISHISTPVSSQLTGQRTGPQVLLLGTLLREKAFDCEAALFGGAEEAGFVSGKDMPAVDAAIVGQTFLLKNQDVVDLVFTLFQAQDLGDGGDLSAAIEEPGGLEDNMNGRGHLFAQSGEWEFNSAQPCAGFPAGKTVAGGVGVDGGHAAIVTSIHRLE